MPDTKNDSKIAAILQRFKREDAAKLAAMPPAAQAQRQREYAAMDVKLHSDPGYLESWEQAYREADALRHTNWEKSIASLPQEAQAIIDKDKIFRKHWVDGAWEVRYCPCPTSMHYNHDETAKDLRVLNETQKRALKTAMSRLSAVAPVRYVEVQTHEEADLNIASATLTGAQEKAGAYTKLNESNKRDIVIRSDYTYEVGMTEMFLHELSHALGLKHPYSQGKSNFENGDHKDFDKEKTCISYNECKHREHWSMPGSLDKMILPILYEPLEDTSVTSGLPPQASNTARPSALGK